MTSEDQARDEADEAAGRARDRGVLALLALLLVLFVGAAIGGVALLWDRFESGDDDAVASGDGAPGEPAPIAPEPVGSADDAAGAGAAPNPGAADRARQAMQARYRPGPHVETVGLLPSGLGTLRRLASTSRGGRTVDNPWIVAGAELRPGTPPSASGAGAPSSRFASPTPVPVTVIPGTPTRLPVRAGAGAGADGEVAALLVSFRDYDGFFYLPAVVESELGTIRVAGMEDVELQFGIDAPVGPGGAPLSPDKELRAWIRIAAVDVAGRVSPFVERELRVLPVGTGDVEVTLSMSEATDLDLYVMGPTGNVIYYGHTRGYTQGQLDLDANAGCGGNMGVNNEHVFWPRGAAPAGTYVVRVAHYRSCIGGRGVDYRVTVRNCGETAVFRGRFEGEGDTRTCMEAPPDAQPGWCQQVVSFDVTPCAAAGP